MKDPWTIPLGWDASAGTLRLCAPSADHVEVLLRAHPGSADQRVVAMRQVELGAGRRVWQAHLPDALGQFYRYRAHLPAVTVEVADPWARAIARRKHPSNDSWAVALPPPPRLPRPAGVRLPPRSLALLEVHLGDWTQDPSAGVLAPGTYAGAAEDHPAAVGGVHDAVRMGFDGVELLPIASWPVFERAGVNHWGYMPSFLLAAAERHARAWAATPVGGWVGVDASGRLDDPFDQLRALVDALHARGVAVVLDVVWNHVSLADRNPLLLLDPGAWFVREHGRLRSHSGCGNDLDTRQPEVRALLAAAVDRWVGELGVDGLRLDLGAILDDATLAALASRARALRPDVWLSAEPWSLASYRPEAIAAAGYAVWNDRSRNFWKGHSPGAGGALWADGADPAAIQRALEGERPRVGGALPDEAASVSYLECHDGWTLRDFVHLCHGAAPGGPTGGREDDAMADRDRDVLALAALLLAATRGPVLLHAGQAWGRSRRAPGGQLVDNAWDRDDAASHLDWGDRAREPQLVAWTAACLALRKGLFRLAFEAGAPRWFAFAPHGQAFAAALPAVAGAPASLIAASLRPHGDATIALAPLLREVGLDRPSDPRIVLQRGAVTLSRDAAGAIQTLRLGPRGAVAMAPHSFAPTW